MPRYRFINKKVFVPDPVTGRCRITLEDLNEISEALIEADPLTPDAVPAWFQYSVDATDFAVAATESSIPLFELLPAGVIHAVKIKHSSAWTGGAISACTLKLGITGTLDKYFAAFDVFQAPGATVYAIKTPGGSGEPAGESHIGNTEILITANSTDANLDQLTSGAAEVWVLMSRVASPS